jgi:hypothetical protein
MCATSNSLRVVLSTVYGYVLSADIIKYALATNALLWSKETCHQFTTLQISTKWDSVVYPMTLSQGSIFGYVPLLQKFPQGFNDHFSRFRLSASIL